MSPDMGPTSIPAAVKNTKEKPRGKNASPVSMLSEFWL